MGWNGEPGSHRASPDESLGGSVRNMKLRRIHWIAAAIGLAGAAVPFAPTSFLASRTGAGEEPTRGGRLVGTGATSLGPRQSSPVALTSDDNTLVNVNPESNTVTVFDVTSDQPDKLAEVGVGGDPSSVAIAPDGDHAYVTNALDGTISVVRLKNPAIYTVSATVGAGAEPHAVALSPNGTRLYVANSASNNLMVFDATKAAPKKLATVDLSPYGTAPRAIGITNDGDTSDADETVFVALFFGQLRPGKTSTEEGQDDQREGRVVAISAATNLPLGAPNPIVLRPIANTSFNSNGRLAPGPGQVPAIASTNPQTFTSPTGCYPNQLAAVAIRPGQSRAYLVSTGASPNGPFRFNSNAQGMVSVFNTATRVELVAVQTDPTVRRTAPLNLDQGVNLATTPAPRLFFTNPVAMAWRPDGSDAWIAVQQADVLLRLSAGTGGVPTVGAPLVAGPSSIVRVDLQATTGTEIQGKAPRGLAINSTGDRAYVFNFVSRSITVVNISNPTAPVIAGTARASDLPADGTLAAFAHLGEELFYTGRGPQGRMSQEAWGACIVCHPGGRSDNATWMFEAGPRQTIPLDGMFSKVNFFDQRILNWSAVRDEDPDFELNTRGVFGGRGLIDDDRLFLAVGGASGAGPADTALIEQFQQATGAVGTANDLAGGAALPALLGARRDFALATLSDDRVFVIGGRSGAGQGSLVGAATAVLELNPRTNTIVPRNSVGFTLRHSLGAAAVKTSGGPRIYAVGGYASTSPAAMPVPLVQEYDPATNAWRTVAALPTAVAQFGITVAGGINTAEPRELIHVVSGNTGSEAAPTVANPNPVQRFQADPAGAGTWTTFNPAGLTLRRNHGAAGVLRGVSSRVFVVGGQDAGGIVLDSVEEYTAQAVAVVATPHTPLPGARARFGIAGSLSGNQVYVVGGTDAGGADQTTVLEYTVGANGLVAGPPGTPSGNWVTRANLSAARRQLQLSNPPGVTNFLPARSSLRDARQDSITAFIALNVRSSRTPEDGNSAGPVHGRQLFGEVGLVVAGFSCATCHGGPKWTRSRVDYFPPPSPELGLGLGSERVIGAELRQTATQGPNVLINVGTFTLGGGRTNELRFNAADISQAIPPLGANGFNIPSVLSVHETRPYFYSGLAQTLEEVLNGAHDTNGGVRHHFVADPAQRADLISFLRSIDQTTPTFP
jgi:YVTN family beta-propeller protein